MKIAQRAARYMRTLRQIEHLYQLGQYAKIGALLNELDSVDMEIVQWALDTIGAEPGVDAPSPTEPLRSVETPTSAGTWPHSSSPSAPVIPLDSYSRRVPCS